MSVSFVRIAYTPSTCQQEVEFQSLGNFKNKRKIKSLEQIKTKDNIEVSERE